MAIFLDNILGGGYISGYSGATGVSGRSGFSGAAGSAGTSGFSGVSGTNGSAGASGFSGASGTTGVSGRSGFSGTNGTNGSAGASGFSGASGTTGVSGQSGWSGFSGTSGFSGPLQINIPPSANTTVVAADAGKFLDVAAGVTINSSTGFVAGGVVSIYNDSAASITITATAITLRLAGTATTGNRTLAQRGIATVLCVGTNDYVISGAGLT